MKELMMATFFISAPLSTQAGPEQDAYKHIAMASYKVSGLEEMVQDYVEREVPEPLQKITGDVFLVVKTIQERRITYVWRF